MQLNLKNPLVFFDLETTGINISTDRIVEISYLKVYPDGREETKTMRINPGMPIPPEATAVHKITDADVAGCPTFKEVAKTIAADLEGCDLAGYNSNRFDVPLLVEELLRAGVSIDISRRKLIDVQTIFHKMEQRTLSAAYKFYCDKDLNDAHAAEADTRATYEVLKAQLDRSSKTTWLHWPILPLIRGMSIWPGVLSITIKEWRSSISENTKAVRWPKYSRSIPDITVG